MPLPTGRDPIMSEHTCDVLVVGSGFGGSLMAMVLAKLGLRSLVVERGNHPRFALGESSTPLANLVLEQLATTYDIPELLPCCQYGTWKRDRPELVCGLKRGFSYFEHQRTSLFESSQIVQISCLSLRAIPRKMPTPTGCDLILISTLSRFCQVAVSNYWTV